MLTKVTKDAIGAGAKSAGQDYFGAIKGALTVAGDLAYPVCATMNGIAEDEINFLWLDDMDDNDLQKYDQYFL